MNLNVSNMTSSLTRDFTIKEKFYFCNVLYIINKRLRFSVLQFKNCFTAYCI